MVLNHLNAGSKAITFTTEYEIPDLEWQSEGGEEKETEEDSDIVSTNSGGGGGGGRSNGNNIKTYKPGDGGSSSPKKKSKSSGDSKKKNRRHRRRNKKNNYRQAHQIQKSKTYWAILGVCCLGVTSAVVLFAPTSGSGNGISIVDMVFGGIIFIATGALSYWMYNQMIRNNQMYELYIQAEAERNIVKSLFPSNVRDRLLQDAAKANGTTLKTVHGGSSADLNGMSGNSHKQYGAKKFGGPGSGNSKNNAAALTSEKIYGSKPIADFFTDVTIMFADLVGFTAWSSSRDPTQVFALLEVIYHSYDQMAKKRGVFKLETVGDC